MLEPFENPTIQNPDIFVWISNGLNAHYSDPHCICVPKPKKLLFKWLPFMSRKWAVNEIRGCCVTEMGSYGEDERWLFVAR